MSDFPGVTRRCLRATLYGDLLDYYKYSAPNTVFCQQTASVGPPRGRRVTVMLHVTTLCSWRIGAALVRPADVAE